MRSGRADGSRPVDAVVASEARPRARRRGLGVTQWLGIAIAVGGLGFVLHRISDSWDRAREVVLDADLRLLIAAYVVGFAGMAAMALPWADVVRALGGRLRRTDALLAYLVGELGKYVPGGVWPVVGRGELAHRTGLARVVSYTGVLVSLATLYLAALTVAGALLPVVAIRGEWSSTPVVLLPLLLPVGVVCLHPRVLRRLLDLAERITKLRVEVPLPTWGTMSGLVLRYVPAWILIASATWLVTRALAQDIGWPEVAFATVLSWSAGFLVGPAPGGLGVREAVFAAVTASALGDIGAVTAVVVRLVFMVVDGSAAALAGTAMLAMRSSAPDATGRAGRHDRPVDDR